MKPWVDVTDPRVVKALAHPLRVRILSMLDESVLSPTQMADTLEVPIGNVSYHTRQLLELGLIELVRETPRRGAVEHHYSAVARPLITDEAWRAAPEIVRRAMVGATLEESAKAVNSAALTGGFSRDGAHVSRIPTPLDERGWKEISRTLEATMKRIQKIAEASQQRLRKTDHEGEAHATTVMMFFEDAPVAAKTPSRAQPRSRRAGRARRASDLQADSK
jgi:DNA-binding transcriptional ArsR family regulator